MASITSKGKRTKIDFSKHKHTTEIYTNKEGKEIQIDNFKIDGTICNSMKFINVGGVMSVTGDFGNWIFNRNFYPSAKGYISDGYWVEKLRHCSEQKIEDLDVNAIRAELEELIETGLEEHGYENIGVYEELDKAKVWFIELLDELDDGQFSYLAKAYRDPYKPDFIDDEMIPDTKKIPVWLLIIFDGLDEMCIRMKEEASESVM